MEKINPPALLHPVGDKHVHVTLVPAGSSIAYIAGQVAFAKNGDLIGKGDLGKQAEQCFANIRDTLTALNAQPEDIAKMTMYVVDYKPEDLAVVSEAGEKVFGERWPVTATSLFGVQALGFPDFLIEIEAVVEISAGSAGKA